MRTGRVQAIDRAVMILRLFSDERRELKLTDIAEELDLNKSTVHGIISTLKYHGLIDQNEDTQKYRLGLYLMELGDRVSHSLDIIEISSPIIKDLCSQVEETVHLGTLDGDEVVYIDKKESNQSMRIFSAIGARNPAHCTGVGKAMLAYRDMDKLEELLPDELVKLTPHTITDKKELIKELSQIREQGYALDNEENTVGLTCVAAPIFDKNGEAKYAISISGPTIRMNYKQIEKAKELVMDSTKRISRKLGYKD